MKRKLSKNGLCKQVKCRSRVASFGEVFTAEREVKAMLDLVKQETERIDSRFLEPACGNGNFLAEVLVRKLAVVAQRYKKCQVEFERYAIVAVGSIYGIDILQDNVEECQERLFDIFNKVYKKLYKVKSKIKCQESIRFILSQNIIWGDALSLKRIDGSDIVFAQWSAVNGVQVQRCDFTLTNMLNIKVNIDGLDLFDDMDKSEFIADPIRVYKLSHYLELADNVK